MALPLVLAGPVLRRVEPRLVTVWMALRESAEVTLSLWTSIANGGSGDGLFSGPAPDFTSDPAQTVRVCENLHIALVTLDIPPPDLLFPAQIFSYNVAFTTATGSHDLKSEGLLRDNSFDGHLHAALGYGNGDLPSFAMPPAEITELRLLHYSCRRPHERGPDALAFVDEMIERDLRSASERPHLLFMTGDQIYADDVAMSLLPILTDLGQELLGSIRETVTGDAGPIEVSQENLPAALRQDFMEAKAGFTSLTSSHLFSFGEYAAMYLAVWNNVLWPTPEPDGSFPLAKFQLFEDLLDRIEGANEELMPTWRELFRPPDELSIGQADLELFVSHLFITLPRNTLLDFFVESGKRFDASSLTETRLRLVEGDDLDRFRLTYGFAETLLIDGRLGKFKAFAEWMQGRFGGMQETSERELAHMKLVYERLPKVRRALANVPCYMMWDDHDVTDDWNLTRSWRNQVLGKDTGVTVLRNGMLAGALFQLWGNDPKAFLPNPADADHPNSKRAQFLVELQGLYPTGQTEVDQTAVNELNKLFGLDGSEPPPLRWHFRFEGPRFNVLFLDTRTRRDYHSLQTPPMLLSEGAIEEQIPEGPLPAGLEVLLVVSPVPVLGPPVDEEIARPLAARLTDFIAALKNKRPTGHVRMDIEWWSADPPTFEKLLARLESYKKVVFLSGDVHHGLGAELDYWKHGESEPARFVQFTSSPANNIVPKAEIVPITGNFGLAQRILRLGVPLERMVWEEPTPPPISVPGGQVATPQLRAALRRKPVLIPTHVWPAGTATTRAPDSTWRLNLLIDNRIDSERPEPVEAKPLPPDFDTLPRLEQYRILMDRHIDYVKKNNFGRVFVFPNNVGVLRFAKDANELKARHEVWSVHPDQVEAGKPLVYTIHRASVEPTTASPPGLP